MAATRKRLPAALAALAALAMVAYLFWMLAAERRGSSAHPASPEARAPARPRAAAPPARRAPAPATAAPARPTAAPAPATAAPAPAASSAPAASQAFSGTRGPSAADVQCSRDGDCAGPRQAECIRPSCLEGYCVYDDSHCECASSSDCDDGDPCTRNHCFVPTMKCIFIPEGCD